MDGTNQEVIEQTMVTLPFLDDEVPALYLADGRPYIPVCAVCRALGIRADTHIRRWRTLVLWITARKLPFQTEKRVLMRFSSNTRMHSHPRLMANRLSRSLH